MKAPSNNVKLQSDTTLTTQIYFFLIKKQMGLGTFSLMRLGNKSSKRRNIGNNEVKLKNESTFLKPNNFKRLKNQVALNDRK